MKYIRLHYVNPSWTEYIGTFSLLGIVSSTFDLFGAKRHRILYIVRIHILVHAKQCQMKIIDFHCLQATTGITYTDLHIIGSKYLHTVRVLIMNVENIIYIRRVLNCM